MYESDTELSNVMINNNKLLLYSALSDEEGEMHIIDAKGSEILSRKFQSYETDFAWNPHNENELLVTPSTAWPGIPLSPKPCATRRRTARKSPC